MQMLSLLIGYKCVRMLWDDIKKWGRSKLGTKGGAKNTRTRSKVQRTRADSGLEMKPRFRLKQRRSKQKGSKECGRQAAGGAEVTSVSLCGPTTCNT